MADTSSTAKPTDNFYYLRGSPDGPGPQRVDLDRDPSVYAVRFKPGQRTDSQGLSRGARRFLQDDSAHLGFVANYRLQVYQGTPRDIRERSTSRVAINAMRAGIRNLGRQEDVEYASPGYRVSRGNGSGDVMFVNNRFLVRFLPEVSNAKIEQLNQEHRVRIEKRVTFAENTFVMELIDERDGDRVIAVANIYFASNLTLYAHPDFIQRRHFKTVATARADTIRRTSPRSARDADPEFLDEQWHLDVAKVKDAWNITDGSEQIVIAIIDDGVDTGHPEFSSKLVGGHDFANGIDDPTPKRSYDNHGTSVAGVATAAGVSAKGVAPGCSLMAIKMPLVLGSADEAEMFRWVSDSGADVINCSWGPEDETGAVDPLPDIVRDAIHHCVKSGRGGKGIPIFWAAGNGNESVSNDGYASNREIIAVAASTEEEVRAPYSDFGPEIWITAPSNGGPGREIFTTDRRGTDGYNTGESALGDPSGDYTNDFGGTSSASPLAAGIGALMLSAKRGLAWWQVKNLLRDTAVKIPDASHYDNGHSDEYGYGRVDAHAAVIAAGNTTPAVTETGVVTPEPATTGPSITGPACWGRSNQPPQFQVNRGTHNFYAVEVASDPNLMKEGAVLSDDFFATYLDTNPNRRFFSSSTYKLPEDVWSRLKSAPRLFYRIWTSKRDSGWEQPVVTSTLDEHLGPDMPSINLSGCEHAPNAARTVTYPSGATFEVVAAPDDGVDYSDPVADGVVPLIEVSGRRGEKLAKNFIVDELDAKDGASYARVSPELVAGLQRLRDRLGASLIINSGYRHPVLNVDADGAKKSQHMAGQAADVRAPSKTPLELARLALEEIGCDIGIGLGKNIIHVDVRGISAAWVYKEAELDKEEFKQWVRETCDELDRSRLARSFRHMAMEPMPAPPTITAPDTHSANVEPPVFAIEPGPGLYFGVEVATDCKLLDPANSGDRRTDNYFASYEGGELLPSPGSNRTVTWQPPVDAWRQLTSGLRLYYRVVVSRTREARAFTAASTSDDFCSDAPWIDITGGRALRTVDLAKFMSIAESRRADEQRWRKEQ